ncbi:MAG: OB-fold nucleic acid binding domain-containing protein [Bacteroidia bacterium]|nr:OB-fold nucleic acid binding domain-containing protein [Bacteroidia bacterium]MDW8347025.1 amino acid--tRNA ligase-related protein [Bacteroidia bacterium]
MHQTGFIFRIYFWACSCEHFTGVHAPTHKDTLEKINYNPTNKKTAIFATMNTRIIDLPKHEGNTVTVQGWIYNIRESKGIKFLVIRDGSEFCQAVISQQEVNEQTWKDAEQLTQESSLAVTGKVVPNHRDRFPFEIQVQNIQIYQIVKDYPITHKEHGVDFLMNHRHLWLRTPRQWAIMRVRNRIIYAIHQFFQEQGFVQMDAPIFTANACEGTSTLFETDYYGTPAYLSQSGQLYGEAMAMAMGKIYTFGPTFRAEKSQTRRHLSEFWMIEPEMAFYDLDMNMDLIESMLKYIVHAVLTNCRTELNLLQRDTSKLQKLVDESFIRMTYQEAVELLKSDKTQTLLQKDLENAQQQTQELLAEQKQLQQEHPSAKKGRKAEIDRRLQEINATLKDLEELMRNIPQWMKSAKEFELGNDFGGSDETVITRHFEVPIMVHRYPHEVKAFYMKRDPKDSRWAMGVDVLAPEGYGEIVGGGERETDEQVLIQKIQEHNLPMSAFEWYLDLRRFGSVPHSGFGLGLERLVAYVAGLHHVRETIPFARHYNRLTP